LNDLVLAAHDGPLTTITLNRAQRHNSLTPEFLAAIRDAFQALPHSTRVVVLQANGRSFSTGGDLQGFYDHLDDLQHYAQQIVGRLNELILAMVDLDLPVVTAVQGIVTGGSLGLILASDIVLAAPAANFTPYYPVVGFSPDGGWSAWLATIIGPRRAAESLLCNRPISANEAVGWGLATRLVEADRLAEEARETARAIASLKQGSIRSTKQLLGANREYIADLLNQEKRHFVQQIGTEEAKQGIVDFLANSGVEG
jgi:2-(1,2-epoxy-1,2-dihydrophenyl)acetyl-CoA isomerase